MGMNGYIANGINDADSKSASNYLPDGELTNGENGMIEPSVIMEILTRLEIDLAYSSEKLVNFDLYMTMVSLGENGLEELSMHKSNISEVEIEKALMFDLLFGYLDSEVTELGHFLNAFLTNIIKTHQQVCSFRQKRKMFTAFQEKLHTSENSLKHLQEQLSELKRQLADLHGTLSNFREKITYSFEDENLESSGFSLQTAGQQRLVLRMLEKSLAAELDLEKQLLESKEREEELESKLLHTNDIVSCTESFAEVALERLLEAEHSSQVFMGFAKEMMSCLQICQFNMHCSVRREEELKSKLQSSLEQMKEKENAEMNRRSQEKENLEKKVKELEEKLRSSKLKLREVNASYELSQEQLLEMENAVESLREHVFMVENRAHNAEEKLAAITEENIELREEVGFLKGGDSNEEKISLLEKQARDMEVQLQTAKASSDASLEQQNMLYTAIWDMETLIEELKSKVSKAESRAENAEEQCLVLAETSIELNKEISYLRSESEKLEESLKEANKTKIAQAKDISNGAKLMTELVMQLTIERERIQKQMSSLVKENKILLEELRKMRKNNAKAKQDNKEGDQKGSDSVADNTDAGIRTALSTTEEVEETPTSAAASNQVDELSEQNSTDEAEAAGSCTSEAPAAVANCTDHEVVRNAKTNHLNKKSYILVAVLVLVFSILAMSVNWEDTYSILRHQYLGLQ